MAKAQLILLHGALGSKSYFNELEKSLQEDFQVYSFDFSGHGKNKGYHTFSVDGFKTQLSDYCIENKIENACVFGYSMGGYIALYLSAENPNLFKYILSYGTKFQWNKDISKNEIKHLDPIKIKEKVPSFGKYLQRIHPARNWEELLVDTQKLMLDLGENNRISKVDLSKVDIPIQIGLGSEDKMVSREESLEIVNKLPNAKLKEFVGFSHAFEKLDIVQLSKEIKKTFLV